MCHNLPWSSKPNFGNHPVSWCKKAKSFEKPLKRGTLSPCQFRKKNLSVEDGSDKALYSIILQAAHEPLLVIEGECCNLLRRLHLPWGEFGTILLALCSTEWSRSLRGAQTLVHFRWPSWHKFFLKCWNDCRSSRLAHWRKRWRVKNHSKLSWMHSSFFWLYLHRKMCPFWTRDVLSGLSLTEAYCQNIGCLWLL